MRMFNTRIALLGLVFSAEAQTWSPQTSGTTNALSSVHFISADVGWAVGATGTILKTVNGGVSWTPQTSGTTDALYSVHFASRDTGWAVGGYVGEFSRSVILRTTDGGASWTPQNGGAASPLHSVHFVNSALGYAVGDGGVALKTVNGGCVWTRVG